MHAHVRFLIKRDEEETKKTKRVLNSSIKIAANKINHS